MLENRQIERRRNIYIKLTRMGNSIIKGEDPVMFLAKKTINYITTDEHGHCKVIMHRGAVLVEESPADVLRELFN